MRSILKGKLVSIEPWIKVHVEALYKMAGAAELVQYRHVSRQLAALGESLSIRCGDFIAEKLVSLCVTPSILASVKAFFKHTRHTAWATLCWQCRPGANQLYAAVVAALDIAGHFGQHCYATVRRTS